MTGLLLLSFVLTVGFLLCPSQLNVAGASDLWKQALQDGFVVSLVRDEVFFIFGAFESVLNNSKDKKCVHIICMPCLRSMLFLPVR